MTSWGQVTSLICGVSSWGQAMSLMYGMGSVIGHMEPGKDSHMCDSLMGLGNEYHTRYGLKGLGNESHMCNGLMGLGNEYHT